MSEILLAIGVYFTGAMLTTFIAQMFTRYVNNGDLDYSNQDNCVVIGVLWPVSIPYASLFLCFVAINTGCTKASKSVYKFFHKGE